MIVIRVELWSAITGEKTELARMRISNVGGTATLGDYLGETYIGRDSKALDRQRVAKRGTIQRYPRQAIHVWNLISRMLANMGYK